jgi:hypothetical protein
MVIDAILLNGAAGLAVGGAWIAKALWSGHNGNGKLSKDDHKELCEPVKKRLDEGDFRFQNIMQKIDNNHKETLDYILDLTKELSKR